MIEAAAASPRTLFGQPVGLVILFLTEMWEKFSFYGMRALLVYYMTKQLMMVGYTANAMVVWELPDAEVERVGGLLPAEPEVTLCYQRRRHLPEWPYNLYCMIHGRERAGVERAVAELRERFRLGHVPHAILFSRRRFKQRGAHYIPQAEAAHG